MPKKRMALRMIKDVIRLKWEAAALPRADRRRPEGLQGRGDEVRSAGQRRGPGLGDGEGLGRAPTRRPLAAPLGRGFAVRVARLGARPSRTRPQGRDADAAVAGVRRRAPARSGPGGTRSSASTTRRSPGGSSARCASTGAPARSSSSTIAGSTVPLADGKRAQVFVSAMAASSYTFACATGAQKLEDWIGSMVRALAFYGGVPQLIVPDNARALIADPDRYEPRANQTVLDFARHYGTSVLPARPGLPTRQGHRGKCGSSGLPLDPRAPSSSALRDGHRGRCGDRGTAALVERAPVPEAAR